MCSRMKTLRSINPCFNANRFKNLLVSVAKRQLQGGFLHIQVSTGNTISGNFGTIRAGKKRGADSVYSAECQDTEGNGIRWRCIAFFLFSCYNGKKDSHTLCGMFSGFRNHCTVRVFENEEPVLPMQQRSCCSFRAFNMAS